MSSGILALSTYHRASSLGEGTYGSVITVYSNEGNEYALKIFDNQGDDDVSESDGYSDDCDASYSTSASSTYSCEPDTTLEVGTLRELSILRILRDQNAHNSIVQMLDIQEPTDIAGSSPGHLSMVMPIYPLGDFSDYLDGGKFPKSNSKTGRAFLLHFAHDLLDAVSYLAENGILHRDIKADNIMVSHHKQWLRPVLIDFSLAKILDSEGPMSYCPTGMTHTSQIGTPTYCAPEVVNEESYSFPSDCWSVGVILLEALSGHTLAVDRDKAAFRVVGEAKENLPDKPFANLIRGLLEIDPDKRWNCRKGMESQVFQNRTHGIPDMQRVDWEGCLDTLSQPATPQHTGVDITPMKRRIREMVLELECEPALQIENAANAYARELKEIIPEFQEDIDDYLSDCVILAEKFLSLEMRHLAELNDDDGEEWKLFENWSLERYKEIEMWIFKKMDYCLYLRQGESAPNDIMPPDTRGRKKKKKKGKISSGKGK